MCETVFPAEVEDLYEHLCRGYYHVGDTINVVEGQYFEKKSHSMKHGTLRRGMGSMKDIVDELTKYFLAFYNTTGGLLIEGLSDDGVISCISLSEHDIDVMRQSFALLMIKNIPETHSNSFELRFFDLSESQKSVVIDDFGSSKIHGAAGRSIVKKQYLVALSVLRHRAECDPYVQHNSIVYIRMESVVVARGWVEQEQILGGVPPVLKYLQQQKKKELNELEDNAIELDKHLMEMRMASLKLPIYKYYKEICQSVVENRITFIRMPTGTGKSTQVPIMLMEQIFEKRGVYPKIVVTQQRRLGTTRNAERCARILGSVIPGFIGFMIGGRNLTSIQSHLIFKTSSLLQGSLFEILFKMKTSFVPFETVRDTAGDILIFDEIHERDLSTDVCLALAKYLSVSYPTLRIVLMTATKPRKEFTDYLNKFTPLGNVSIPNISRPDLNPVAVSFFGQLPNENVEFITGVERQYPLKHLYMDDSVLKKYFSRVNFDSFSVERPSLLDGVKYGLINFLAALVNGTFPAFKYVRLPVRAVLVFLPGFSIIQQFKYALLATEFGDKIDVFILHSAISPEEHKKALSASRKRTVKVILSTDIAESSLTIPDVSIIINSCLSRNIVCNHNGVEILTDTWISKSSLDQRAGRCARKQRGLAVHCLPRAFIDDLHPDIIPEIQRVSLNTLVLSVCEMYSFLYDIPDCPKESHIVTAIRILERDQLIEKTGPNSLKPTKKGNVIRKIPLGCDAASFVLDAVALGLGIEGVVLGCLLDRKAVLKSPVTRPFISHQAYVRFSLGTRSDLIANYNAYVFFLRNKTSVLNFYRAKCAEKGIPCDKKESYLYMRNFFEEPPYFISLFFLLELDCIVVAVRNALSRLGLVEQLKDWESRNRFDLYDLYEHEDELAEAAKLEDENENITAEEVIFQNNDFDTAVENSDQEDMVDEDGEEDELIEDNDPETDDERYTEFCDSFGVRLSLDRRSHKTFHEHPPDGSDTLFHYATISQMDIPSFNPFDSATSLDYLSLSINEEQSVRSKTLFLLFLLVYSKRDMVEMIPKCPMIDDGEIVSSAKFKYADRARWADLEECLSSELEVSLDDVEVEWTFPQCLDLSEKPESRYLNSLDHFFPRFAFSPILVCLLNQRDANKTLALPSRAVNTYVKSSGKYISTPLLDSKRDRHILSRPSLVYPLSSNCCLIPGNSITIFRSENLFSASFRGLELFTNLSLLPYNAGDILFLFAESPCDVTENAVRVLSKEGMTRAFSLVNVKNRLTDFLQLRQIIKECRALLINDADFDSFTIRAERLVESINSRENHIFKGCKEWKNWSDVWDYIFVLFDSMENPSDDANRTVDFFEIYEKLYSKPESRKEFESLLSKWL